MRDLESPEYYEDLSSECEERMMDQDSPHWRDDPEYFMADSIRAKRRQSISLAGRASGEARREMRGPQQETVMTKTIEVTQDALDKMIADAVAKATPKRATRKAKDRVKPTPEETAARMAANDAECLKVFTEAGYKDVQPRKNVLTYGKIKPDGKITGWLGQGRRVKAGEKSLQVGPFRLFHFDQTEAITAH